MLVTELLQENTRAIIMKLMKSLNYFTDRRRVDEMRRVTRSLSHWSFSYPCLTVARHSTWRLSINDYIRAIIMLRYGEGYLT